MNPYAAPHAPVYDAVMPPARAGRAGTRASCARRPRIRWYRDAWRLYTIAPGPWIGVALMVATGYVQYRDLFVAAEPQLA